MEFILMEEYNLQQTVNKLSGPTKEQMIVHNNWAATAFDRYHNDSRVEIEFIIHGQSQRAILNWDSNFSKAAMKG
jgi:hypothetical protein